MSLISRIANAFRPDRVNRDLDEELQSHLDEAVENGRDPAEARRAFGSVLRQREASRGGGFQHGANRRGGRGSPPERPPRDTSKPSSIR